MIRAFWFVTSRSFKNRLLMRLRKLRSARYAISMLAGLAYIYFFAFRNVGRHGNVSPGLPAGSFGVDVASVMVLIGLLVAWALPDSTGGLTFTPSEIQFLFPAPLRRRDLLLYKIFRQQPSIFISSLMVTLFGMRNATFVGMWAAFAVLWIYFLMVGMARARLSRMHIGFIARVVATLAAGGVFIMLVIRDVRGWAGHVADFSAFIRMGKPLFHSAELKAILFVPRFFAAAALSGTAVETARAIAVLAVIGFVLFQIAVRIDVSFEDASLEASQRKAETMAMSRSLRIGGRVMFRRLPPPFRLSGSSLPELAIVWKNLIACFRTSIAWVFLMVLIFAAFVVDAMLFRSAGGRVGAATMGLIFSAFFPFLGSQVMRQDLRLDLTRIEVLKSLPIRGDRMVAAQIAAPTLVVSAIELFFLVATAVTAQLSGMTGRLAFAGSPEFIVIALLFAIPICAAQLLLHNAVAILLPGWAVQSGEESRGFAVFGQRLVILGANIVVLSLALLPAAVVCIPAYLIARHFGSNPFVLAVSTAPAVAVLIVEIWIAIRFLGSQFEQIDITNEIDAAV